MGLKSNFELMADYNQWMNKNLYKVCDGLSSNQLGKDRGAYFGSILGTLNHILVGDIIWLKRFATHPSGFQSLSVVESMDNPGSLSQVLHSDLNELAKFRGILDAAIVDFSRETSEHDYELSLSYINTKGVELSKSFSFLVHHLFNHQTHHRGQVTTLLSQLDLDVGMTDLLALMPEAESLHEV